MRMPVTSFFTIGNLSVPSSWIALIAAFVVAYSAVRFRYGKKHAEIIGDAFFYLVIVWKLSLVLTDYESVLRSPLAIIYFNGGVVGFYLGLLFIAGKILWNMKKGLLGADGFRALFTGAVSVQVVYQVMMVLLNEGELIAQVVTVVVFGLFAVFFWVNSGKSGNWPVQLALVFMAVHVFVSAVQLDEFIQTPLISTLVMGLFFVIVFMRKVDWRNNYE